MLPVELPTEQRTPTPHTQHLQPPIWNPILALTQGYTASRWAFMRKLREHHVGGDVVEKILPTAPAIHSSPTETTWDNFIIHDLITQNHSEQWCFKLNNQNTYIVPGEIWLFRDMQSVLSATSM